MILGLLLKGYLVILRIIEKITHHYLSVMIGQVIFIAQNEFFFFVFLNLIKVTNK
jgi:hypothetical protein